MKCFLFILLTLLACCKQKSDNAAHTLTGHWQVARIVDVDSSGIAYEYPDYSSIPYTGGSRLHKGRELNADIVLGPNGELHTNLVFTTFGTPAWTTNNSTDSLTLKLTNVQEESLIAAGAVDSNGDVYLYSGKIRFIDKDQVEWILSDGRTFTLKRENGESQI